MTVIDPQAEIVAGTVQPRRAPDDMGYRAARAKTRESTSTQAFAVQLATRRTRKSPRPATSGTLRKDSPRSSGGSRATRALTSPQTWPSPLMTMRPKPEPPSQHPTWRTCHLDACSRARGQMRDIALGQHSESPGALGAMRYRNDLHRNTARRFGQP